MCGVKGLEAGQTWEILQETLQSFFVPIKVSLAMVAAARGVWQSEANSTTAHCPSLPSNLCWISSELPLSEPREDFMGVSKLLTPYGERCRVAGGTGRDGSMLPLLLDSLQPRLLTRPAAAWSHRAEASAHPPREQGPFSACHPIAMTQFHRGISQPAAFSFLSLLSPFSPSLPFTTGI